MRTRTKKKKKLLIPIIIAAAVVLAGAAIIAFLIRNDDKTKTPGTSSQSGINFGPPTEEDKQEVDRNKEEISKEEDTPPPPPAQDGRSVRNPFITYAQQFSGNVELSGYVPGVIEEGGTCKAEFTNGSARVTKESPGFADVNRTSCTPFVIPVSEFSPKGKWSVILSYSSTSSTGTSQAVEVEVK